MLKIRLARTGKKNAPSYRIVVMPAGRPRDGRAIEILGHFNPSVNPPSFSLDKERVKHWLNQGAQMTEAVKKISEGKYKHSPYRPKKESAEKKEKEEKRPEEKEKKIASETDSQRPEDKSDKSKEKESKKQDEKTT